MQADSAATKSEWPGILVRVCVMLGSFCGYELILGDYGWRVFPAFWLVFGAGAFWCSRWSK